MPSPHPTDRPSRRGATVKQLRLMRALAACAGRTFVYPATKAQASAEIQRLCAVIDSGGLERIERERLQSEVEPPADGVAVRDDEIAGDGAHAHWTHHRETRGRA